MSMNFRKIVERIPLNALKKHTSPTSSTNPVESKLILVTGDVSGIGYASARTFLSRKAKGVMLGDINEKDGTEAVKKLSAEFGPERISFIRTDGVFMSSILGFDYMGRQKNHNGGIIINVNCISGIHQKGFHSGCSIRNKRFLMDIVKSLGTIEYNNQTGVRIMGICFSVSKFKTMRSQKQGFDSADGDQTKKFPKIDLCGFVATLCDGENGTVWIGDEKDCLKVRCKRLASPKNNNGG